MDFALEVRGLHKTYKEFELKDISLQLPKGCVLGLIVENGAGKSTLINAVLGLVDSEYESWGRSLPGMKRRSRKRSQ